MTRGSPAGLFWPEPSRRLRLAGIAGILGAILWPITLIVLGSELSTCVPQSCTVDRGSLGVAAIGPALLAIAALALELRARRLPGMADLVGDLTIGTAAVLFVLSFLSGSVGLIGPGLLLFLLGSLIFGIVGYVSGARQRIASALIAIGAGALPLFLLAGASVGASSLETPLVLSLLLFSLGWGWLGGHLLVARPLPILVREDRAG